MLEEIHSTRGRATFRPFRQELFFFSFFLFPVLSLQHTHGNQRPDIAVVLAKQTAAPALMCPAAQDSLHPAARLPSPLICHFSLLSSGVKGKAVQRHSLASSLSYFELLNLLRKPPFLPCRYCTVFQLDIYKPKLYFYFQGVVQGLY